METKSRFIPISSIIAIILIISIVVFNCLSYVTGENQYSVVKQFGKIVTINETSGLRFKVPLVQNVTYIPKSTQLYDISPSDIITSDKKTMIVDCYVLWDVVDAKKFTQKLNASSKTAQGRLDVIVFNAMKTTISSMTQDEVIASRNSNKNIEVLDAELSDININNIENEEENTPIKSVSISQKILNCIGNQCDQYGIRIKDIEIKLLDLPEENKTAVYERMITERKNIATAYTAQGKAEAQVIRNTTDKEVSVTLSEAKAKAEELIAEGEAEYMKILADAYNAEEKADFYLFTLQLDSLEKSIEESKNNVLIIDKNSPFASIFNGINQ